MAQVVEPETKNSLYLHFFRLGDMEIEGVAQQA
jgi:hypothetical protein